MAETGAITRVIGNYTEWVEKNLPKALNSFLDSEKQTEEEIRKQAEISEKKRFNEQCFLIDNIVSLQKTALKQKYENLVLLDGTNPTLAIHKLVSKKGIQELVNLTPAQASLLVPKIRLFKVSYPTKESAGEEIELKFSDYTNQKSIEDILKGKRGRGNDVGLKSFEYDFDGVRPSESGMVKCKLVLHFQSIDTLAEKQSEGYSFLNLIIPEIQDIQKEDANTTEIHRIWNPKYFQIKAEVGWSVPPHNDLFSAELIDKIRNSSLILFLVLQDHTIDWKEDGSAELTVEYRGALEGNMNDTNILVPTKLVNVIESKRSKLEVESKLEKNKPFTGQKIKEISSYEYATQQAWQNIKTTARGVVNLISGEKVDFAEEKIKTKIMEDVVVDPLKNEKDELERLRSMEKQRRYSRIVDEILKGQRIWRIDINDDIMESFLNLPDASDIDYKQQRITAEKYRRLPDITPRVVLPNEKKSLKNNIGALIHDRGQDTIRDSIKKREENQKKKREESKDQKKRDENLETRTVAAIAPIDTNGKTIIHYTTFGNLLESAIRIVNEDRRGNNPIKKFDFLLGPLVFRDPKNRDNLITINLADIPISLNLFFVWFYDEVVKSQSDKFSLNMFIKSLVNKLLVPALGDRCFFETQMDYEPQVGMHMISLPGIGENGQKSPIKVKKGGRYKIENLEERIIGNSISMRGTYQPIGHLHHFIYIYITNPSIITELSGNKEYDETRGIFHLRQGQDRGLVKSISFKKMDIPGEREMRLMNLSIALSKIRSLYNCDVKMIGNNLFSLGQYIYINPTRIGVSNENIGMKLGLGGYYQIITMHHHIDGQGLDYTTELSCKYVGTGGGRNSINKKITGYSKPTKSLPSFTNNPKSYNDIRQDAYGQTAHVDKKD